MNFINAATKKERTHVEEIIRSQPVMSYEGITATEIAICGKRNLFMDVYCPDNGAEKHPIIIDIHGGGLIAGRKERYAELHLRLYRKIRRRTHYGNHVKRQ